jgi:hypothetical protein
MSAPNLVNRRDLLQWADTVPASSEFPRLVRRLILETGRGVVQPGFPAGEGVRAGSWDGTLRSTEQAPYIPLGLSVWELSVEKSAGTKADDDYRKRDATPDGSSTKSCTYVEAILRPWTKRQDWSRDRSAEGKWKEVRGLGVDEIETWLEDAPVTHAWISQVLGRNPYGLRPIDLWWDAWASTTTPALSISLILSGRTKEQEELLRRLTGPAQVTTIKGGSTEEIQSFIAATILQAEATGDDQPKARAAFVDDLATWRELLARENPLILIAASDLTRAEIPPATTRHHVVIPVVDTASADILIPPLDPTAAAAALKEAGVEDQKADRLGRLARSSLLAMRRELANKPELHQPSWARPPVPRSTRSLLLAGQWHEGHEADKDVLASLSGEQYHDLREMASTLASQADPLIARLDAVWTLVSAHDAWNLLAGRIHANDLAELDPIIQEVLGEVDPALDLPREERWWRASVEGKVHKYSAQLRKGTASTLALLGVYGDRVDAGSGRNGADWASSSVRRLLELANANSTGDLWISLSGVLPLLAEAAPDEFLASVDKGLQGDPSLISRFFAEESDGAFGGSTPHTGLLWALETTAWSGSHFGRSVDLLARLAEIDPGGRLSNRPAASLATIFNPWHPDNSVDTSRRLAVLSALSDRHPNIAWNLMLAMLPVAHGIHFPSHEPTFRSWKPVKITVTYGEYFGFVSEIVARLVTAAGQDTSRWVKLIEQMPNLTPTDREVVLGALRQHVTDDDFVHEDQSELWGSLRSLTSHHREYSDAVWALPSEELAKIDQVQDLLRPPTPAERLTWLFQDYTPPVPGHSIATDFQAYEAALGEARKNAALEIDEAEGYTGLRRLAREASQAWWVGVAIADATSAKYESQILSLLGSDDPVDAELGASYVARRFHQAGWPWLERLLEKHAQSMTASRRAIALLQTGDYPKAWERAHELGEEVEQQFWKRFRIYGLGRFQYVAFVAERLVNEGRNAAALTLIEIYSNQEGADADRLAQIAASALEALLVSDDVESGILRQYSFDRLFNLFYEHEEGLGWERIARLEWAYLPALGYNAKPKMLGQLLARDPAFFVELVSVVYRRASGSGETQLSEDERRRAMNAYHLLDDWSVAPGSQDDGHIDGAALSDWMSTAIPLLTEADRLSVGKLAIGNVLAKAPGDPDNGWPCRAIRDLFEEQRSEELENGFSTAVLNSRGVTSRSPEDGGGQERSLVAKYRSDAEQWADVWPRTTALLRSLAVSYERDARGEDNAAERFRRGLER